MTNPFFPTLIVDGQPVNFDHLQPFQFVMATAARPNGATIDVRFSNHCFSEAYDAERHPEPLVEVWDGTRRRVFSQARFDLSLGLRNIVEALPTSNVYHTPEANFVKMVPPGGNGPEEYRIYFNAKRGGGRGDVSLYVESAYCPDFGKQILKPAQMSKVRFAVLVDKTIKGEKLRFHHKR